MKEKVILQDIYYQGNDYIKIITDKGNFVSDTYTENTERLALKALKLVGKQIEVSFISSEEAFDSKFQDIEEIQNNPVELLPLERHFHNKKSQKIFGPPGTGKTTKLIGYVKDAIAKGVKPNDVAFISFSNGAATVAKKRVIEALPDYGSIEFPNFSTMHSLATKIGSETGKKLMVEEHFLAFDEDIKCWKEWTELGNPLGSVERYKHPILDTYNLAIAEQRSVDFSKMQANKATIEQLTISLKKRFPQLINPEFPELCQAYMDEFIAYKNNRRLITFDDVIQKVASASFPENLIPTFELLIIDEAQDLSNHLWLLAKKLISAAKTTYIAGDDDQAIMIGIGANPAEFVGHPTTEPDDPLLNSFRIPKSLRDYIDSGVMPELEKIPNRVGVTWKPNEKIGYLNSGFHQKRVDKNGQKVDIMVSYSPETLLKKIHQDYSIFKKPSIEPGCNSSIPDWLIMAPTKGTGEKISSALAELQVPHFLRNKPILGATKEKSLIRVQTVHMSKGDEAHNSAIVVQTFGDVVMLSKDPRLSYVAVTRASRSCYPRVSSPGLLKDMYNTGNSFFRQTAAKYVQMFPIIPTTENAESPADDTKISNPNADTADTNKHFAETTKGDTKISVPNAGNIKHVFELSIDELLEKDEGNRIEFKQLFFSDSQVDWSKTANKKEKKKEIKYRIVREIAGFLNTWDGVLLVGVTDAKNTGSKRAEVTGINDDEFKSFDDYMENVTNTLHNYFKSIVVNQCINVKLISHQDLYVLVIKCTKGKEPVFIDGKTSQVVWTRSGSTTRELPPAEHKTWFKANFPSYWKN